VRTGTGALPAAATRSERRRRQAIVEALAAQYPAVTTELAHRSPFELLVATVLSAQSTDRGVNAVTPALFARYPDAAALAGAEPCELEGLIQTLGLYRTKARHLRQLAARLQERHAGEVPRDRAALEALPGVGRKTASVVLATAFAAPAIAVDTHVFRLAHRLGLSAARTAAATERDLESVAPPERWGWLHHALIHHGRTVCRARSPDCNRCVLQDLCPSRGAAAPPRRRRAAAPAPTVPSVTTAWGGDSSAVP
jgi:endonuclease-3